MALTDAQFKAWLASAGSIRTVLVEVVARVAGVETTLYLSNRNYVTSTQLYTPCISGGVSFTEELSLDGQPSISYGDIEINNASGERDGWLDYVWVNRAISIYMGDPTWPRTDFRLVFVGAVDDLGSRARNVLNIKLRDKLARLNVPMTETTLGGSTDNKNALVPLAFGECANITPLLADPATLTYKFNQVSSERLIEVRDNGAPITSYVATISTGSFALTAAPVGQITASVQGAKVAPGSAYSNNIATIISHIVQNYGPSTTRISSGDIDTTNFNAFASANVQPVGIYCEDRTNVLAVCQQLAASVGAQVVMTTTGLLRLIKLAIPGSATIAVTAADMEASSLAIGSRPPVRASVKLGYCRNWTTQESGLAQGLPASSVSALGLEYRTVTSTDATVAANYKLDAAPVQEDVLLLVGTDATTEAARRRDLWKTPRAIYTARYLPHLLLTELGDAVTITHPRFGLAAGKTGIVTRISRDWLRGRIEIGVLA